MESKKFLATFLAIVSLYNIVKVKAIVCLPFQSCNDDVSQKLSRYSVNDVFKSGTDIVEGFVNKPINLPSATNIFNLGKQVILGLPFAAAAKAIHVFCSEALASDGIKPKYLPDINKMQFQLLAGCKRHFVPLLQAGNLLKIPDFDIRKKIVLFVTGWTTNANETMSIKHLSKAYRCRGDTNFLVLDAAYFVDTLYSWSAFNTDEIGRLVAVGLNILTRRVPLKNIHLIGHSLGAHIVGAAGRYFTEFSNQIIPRITGLDPANPCFNEGEKLSGLMRGDADFVDVIHSNSGVLGKLDPLGDADFYPGGIVPLVPGCFTIDCAHDRSWEYYLESVYPGNEKNFMATRCTSLTSLERGNCKSLAIPMGIAVPQKVKGTFLLHVNGDSPFGEYSDVKRTQQHKNCYNC